ncbi:MAG: hypothetical protein WA718_23765 [Terriglobales bacterium]
MKKLLAIVVCCLPAFGQAAYSGRGLNSGSATYGAPVGGAPAFYAALPQLWVDNNELTCGITASCYVGSPGLLLTPPAYELLLPGTWISSPPAGCIFHYGYAGNEYWPSSPTAAQMGAGLQQARIDIEACRTAKGGAVGFILDRPPGLYTSTTGFTVPQTSSTLATAPIIERSAMDATLASMPEPICAGGVQDNIPESTNIGLINSDCQAGAGGGTFGYQLGTTVTTIPAGSFTLANGTASTTSNYNYLQYMYQDECSGANCTPLQLCTAGTGGSCASAIGPDHWEFMDGAACLTPGNTSDSNLIYTGSSTVPTNLTQFASHIHFRRYWACGDWTTLAAGYNSVAGGFVLGGCYYCSGVGSQVSQVLRPGGEGHGILGQGTVYKLNNNWIEGSSIDVFDGGFGSAVPISGYTFLPFTDVEQRRNRETFPYFWLGYNCVANGNACGYHY